MANSVNWYGHMLRNEDGHILRRALNFEFEGQREKKMPWITWEREIDGDHM